MVLYHVNFKTLGRRPIFEQSEYDDLIRASLPIILRQHAVIYLAWELMPTHMYLLIANFPDYPRSLIIQRVKGDTARAFFRAFPHLREDLRGGHLWERGYYWAEVRSHRQCGATIAYIQANRRRADLPPPALLRPSAELR